MNTFINLLMISILAIIISGCTTNKPANIAEPELAIFTPQTYSQRSIFNSNKVNIPAAYIRSARDQNGKLAFFAPTKFTRNNVVKLPEGTYDLNTRCDAFQAYGKKKFKNFKARAGANYLISCVVDHRSKKFSMRIIEQK